MPTIPEVEPTQLSNSAPPVPTEIQDSAGPAMSFQRLQSAANTATPDATAPTEDGKYKRIDGFDYKGKPVTIFSTTGDKRTEDEFATALDKYNNSKGKGVDGFTVLEPGIISTIRKGFENVNGPVQDFLASAGRGTGKILAAPGAGFAKLGEVAGILPQGSASGVLQQGSSIGETVGEGVGSTVNRPESAAGTAAALALGTATGGLSIVPQLLRALGVGAATNFATQHIFGTSAQKTTDQQIDDAGKAAFEMGTVQGINGIVKYAIGKGTTELAQSDMAKNMMEVIKKKFGSLSTDPDIVKAWLSTPEGLRDFGQISLKALRGSSDEIAQNLRTGIADLIGSDASLRVGRSNLSSSVNKLVAASDEILDAVGKPKAIAKARQVASEKMQDAIEEIVGKIEKVTVDLSKRENLGNLRLDQASQHAFGQVQGLDETKKLLTDYIKNTQDIVDNASVQDALRLATEGGRFNLKAYQAAIVDNFRKVPGSLQDQLGQIALRGTGLAGTDTTARAGISLGSFLNGVPGVNKIPGIKNLNIGKDIGTNYAGTIPGQLPKTIEAAGNVASQQTLKSIESYMEDSKEK